MSRNGDIMDGIEPCRTCGIFYLTTSNFLRQIFDPSADEYNLSNIRTELAAWNVEINQNDGLPQFICTCCILEFQKLFKFRGLCVELQAQWRHFYNLREENKIYIKKELPEPDEKLENVCDFIYVDDLSDSEYNSETKGNFGSFNISHVPIKEEIVNETPIGNDKFVSTTEDSFHPNEMEMPKGSVESTLIDSKTRYSAEPELLDRSTCSDSSFETKQGLSMGVECTLCRHMSSSAEVHKRHMQRIHEVKDMDCHICGKQFKNSTSTRLKFHLKWHRISKHIKCAQCGFFCDSRETLKEHTKAIHSKVECPTCGKRVLGKKMKIHMRTHELRTWQCSYCDEVFKAESVLESHIWQVHAKEETPPITSVGSPSSNKLLNEAHLPCNHCDQLFATQHDLNAHNLECHLMRNTAEEESYVEGDIQSEQFHYADQTDILQIADTNINDTVESGTNEKEISYDSSNYNEFTHVISSDEETGENEIQTDTIKEFPFPKCTQPFLSTEELCTHYQQHLQKPEFSCHICGKSFELKFSLNRHLIKHKTQ
ncbi:unnamed protein product [Ceratitis capitata]|uniref:(Mediterranean fruit fly) hypothetical protein n=1 Tax=Ceratitis capitata TaxID=7213 RepID=A0A811U0S0_CERCA|nr:unnamed protein product [Ceratitis capitata]